MRTAIRPNAAGLVLAPLLIGAAAAMALILPGCELFAPAEFIKDHTAVEDINEEDFGPGQSPSSIMDIYSGGTKLYAYLDGIKNTAGNYVINLHGGQTHDFSAGGITLGSDVIISLRGTAADTIHLDAGVMGSLFVINSGAKLILRGPTLEGWAINNASVVYIDNGIFNLRSGMITGNTVTTGDGGGVYVNAGTFTMSGGTISGNSAGGIGNGGGVFISSGTFRKTGGTITGTGGPNPNNATGDGDAVYSSTGPKFRNRTAGPGDNVDTSSDPALDTTGFWQH